MVFWCHRLDNTLTNRIESYTFCIHVFNFQIDIISISFFPSTTSIHFTNAYLNGISFEEHIYGASLANAMHLRNTKNENSERCNESRRWHKWMPKWNWILDRINWVQFRKCVPLETHLGRYSIFLSESVFLWMQFVVVSSIYTKRKRFERFVWLADRSAGLSVFIWS